MIQAMIMERIVWWWYLTLSPELHDALLRLVLESLKAYVRFLLDGHQLLVHSVLEFIDLFLQLVHAIVVANLILNQVFVVIDSPSEYLSESMRHADGNIVPC